jgi:NADP-dependent 3-hydroxy acid dehydrogenase YdfG
LKKIVWVIGAAGAVGLAISKSLAQQGHTVILSGRHEAKLQSAQREVGADSDAVVLDVSDSLSVFKARDYIEAKYKRIDVLINTAGINPPKRHWSNLSVEDWDQTIKINLSGMFYACQSVLKGMREQKDGLIINVASWAGHFAAYFAGPAYSSSKRADLALTETINMEECIHGIRATSISPAGIDTPLLDNRTPPVREEVRKTLLKPDDVASVVSYLIGLPSRVCINEILMSPTLNLPYLGELQTIKRPAPSI